MDPRPGPTDGDHRSKGPLVALIIAAVVFGLGLAMCWPDNAELDRPPAAQKPFDRILSEGRPSNTCVLANSRNEFCDETPEGGPNAAATYEEAKDFRKAAGIKKVAAEFNPKADPFEAAEGYAEGYRGRSHQAAFEGCLDGFQG